MTSRHYSPWLMFWFFSKDIENGSLWVNYGYKAVFRPEKLLLCRSDYASLVLPYFRLDKL
jgi:hypothetical protein